MSVRHGQVPGCGPDRGRGDRPLNILVVSRMFPFPPNRGERKRVFYLMRELSRRNRVTLVARVHDEQDRAAVSRAGEVCRRVRWAHVPAPQNPWQACSRVARPLLRGQPLRVGTLCFPEIGRLIRDELESEPYDLVQLHHTPLASYLTQIPDSFRGARVINLHNVETLLLDRLAQSSGAWPARWLSRVDARRMRRWEPRALRRFDHVFTVSDDERERVRPWVGRIPVTTIENGVDVDAPAARGVGTAVPPGLLFIGSMRYPPNEDAVLWCAREILPAIRRRVAGATLTVVGPEPSERVRALAGESVRIAGPVPEVLPYYKNSAVSVIPLRAGGGTRHKILEAMNLGVPVVTTTLGVEGIAARPDVDLLVADTAEAFAAAVVRLLTNPAERARLAGSARSRVEEFYDWRAIGARLERCLRETVAKVRAARGAA